MWVRFFTTELVQMRDVRFVHFSDIVSKTFLSKKHVEDILRRI